MSFSKVSVFALLWMAFNGVCLAAVYEVGDAAGWAKNGTVDYKKWAASKKFFVGDTIVFKYGSGEKLLRVNHTNFKACETRFPVATYTSGDDSFLTKRPTHMYFISAVYGDCMAGQKVDIKVLSPADHSAPTPSPSPAVPDSPASSAKASPPPAVPDSPPVSPVLTPEATPPAASVTPPSAPSPSPKASSSPATGTGLLSFSSLLIALFFV